MAKACGTRKFYDTYLSKNLHRNPLLKALLSVYPPVFRIHLNILGENEEKKVKRRILWVNNEWQKMDDIFVPLIVAAKSLLLKLFENDNNITDKISKVLKTTVIRIFVFNPKALITSPEIWNIWYMTLVLIMKMIQNSYITWLQLLLSITA